MTETELTEAAMVKAKSQVWVGRDRRDAPTSEPDHQTDGADPPTLPRALLPGQAHSVRRLVLPSGALWAVRRPSVKGIRRPSRIIRRALASEAYGPGISWPMTVTVGAVPLSHYPRHPRTAPA